MGSKHILEWTIRVNMFESILYATLHCLKSEGVWDGSVVPITPGKVGPFWIGEEDGFIADGEKQQSKRKVRTSKSAKIKNKGAKIDLVRGWCESGTSVKWGNSQVQEMSNRYMRKWDTKAGRAKGSGGSSLKADQDETGEKMTKLDDLADCLLQGMAWIEWEKNKQSASQKGYQILLDP